MITSRRSSGDEPFTATREPPSAMTFRDKHLTLNYDYGTAERLGDDNLVLPGISKVNNIKPVGGRYVTHNTTGSDLSMNSYGSPNKIKGYVRPQGLGARFHKSK